MACELESDKRIDVTWEAGWQVVLQKSLRERVLDVGLREKAAIVDAKLYLAPGWEGEMAVIVEIAERKLVREVAGMGRGVYLNQLIWQELKRIACEGAEAEKTRMYRMYPIDGGQREIEMVGKLKLLEKLLVILEVYLRSGDHDKEDLPTILEAREKSVDIGMKMWGENNLAKMADLAEVAERLGVVETWDGWTHLKLVFEEGDDGTMAIWMMQLFVKWNMQKSEKEMGRLALKRIEENTSGRKYVSVSWVENKGSEKSIDLYVTTGVE